MTKPSEAVRILLALIAANREIFQRNNLESFEFQDEEVARVYREAYRAGAMDCLRKLEQQLKGSK